MYKVLVVIFSIFFMISCNYSNFFEQDIRSTSTLTSPSNTTSTSTVGTNSSIINQILQRHNYYRNLVFADNNLIWDVTLATHAQAWANYLARNYTRATSSHSPHASHFHQNIHGLPFKGEGENIAWSSNARGYMTPNPVNLMVAKSGKGGSIDAWANEKAYYNYSNNSGNGQVIGHYTQVVWQKTTKVGCGKADSITDYGGEHVVCRYSIAGNMQGEKPYCNNYTVSNFYTDSSLIFTKQIINNAKFKIIKVLEDRTRCIKTERSDGILSFKNIALATIPSFDAFNAGNGSNQWAMNFNKISINNRGHLNMSSDSNNKIMNLKLIGQNKIYYFVEAVWSINGSVAGYTRRSILKLAK